MESIILARSNDPGIDRGLLHDMFRFRHKVFRERLGWEVASRNSMEVDVFDELDPVYMLARNERRAVEGCWRILPTTGPYMLKDTFPQLLRGESAPREKNIWELSRFAVESAANGDLAQANLGPVTFAMIGKVLAFAEQQGIDHYVMVTSVALERLLKRAGFPLRRFGDGKAERVGKVLSVACWVDINDQFRRVVRGAVPALERHREAA